MSEKSKIASQHNFILLQIAGIRATVRSLEYQGFVNSDEGRRVDGFCTRIATLVEERRDHEIANTDNTKGIPWTRSLMKDERELLGKTTAWRAYTGYTHSKYTSAADVVRHEMDDLGNEMNVSRDTLQRLEGIPARRILWICLSWNAARRYGTPSKVDIPDGTEIIVRDEDGGILVLLPNGGRSENGQVYS